MKRKHILASLYAFVVWGILGIVLHSANYQLIALDEYVLTSFVLLVSFGSLVRALHILIEN